MIFINSSAPNPSSEESNVSSKTIRLQFSEFLIFATSRQANNSDKLILDFSPSLNEEFNETVQSPIYEDFTYSSSNVKLI